MNEDENTATPNLWDSVKAVLRGWSNLPQERRKNKINNLTLHLKQLEKEEPQG